MLDHLEVNEVGKLCAGEAQGAHVGIGGKDAFGAAALKSFQVCNDGKAEEVNFRGKVVRGHFPQGGTFLRGEEAVVEGEGGGLRVGKRVGHWISLL
jgi:hypothetical protein